MSINYIGADVDCKMTELAVERNGTIVIRDRIPTDIKSLKDFLGSISGQKSMVIEEGPMAGWLYRNLKSDVDRLVVCDPRRNKLISCDGEKTDAIDAGDLAALLRGGYLREVYHTEDEDRLALKELVGLYHDRVRSKVQQINKLRAFCLGYGIAIPASALKHMSGWNTWLKQLEVPSLVKQLPIMRIGLDAVIEQAKMARREMAQRAKVYPVIRFWQKLPGVGLIRAVTLFAYLDNPYRFSSRKRLWKYCGVGLQHHTSGSDKYGRPKAGNLRLFRQVNYRLKSAIMGAALNAVKQPNNPFSDHYQVMVQKGVTESNTRHTVARKLLTVMWGMWKTNCRYDESLV